MFGVYSGDSDGSGCFTLQVWNDNSKIYAVFFEHGAKTMIRMSG